MEAVKVGARRLQEGLLVEIYELASCPQEGKQVQQFMDTGDNVTVVGANLAPSSSKPCAR